MQHLCFDIDDTITYAPKFFAKLIDSFTDARITIITFRSDRSETESYLHTNHIRYDQLILSTDAQYGKQENQSLVEWKVGLVNEMIVPDIFFEDMPEVNALIKPEIIVFMPCDETIREWIRNTV